jgi:hypothetical protein
VAFAKGCNAEHVAEGIEGHFVCSSPALTITIYVKCP